MSTVTARPSSAAERVGTAAAILGIGSYLPDRVLTNEDLERMVDTSDTWIMERTGIRRRHLAASGQTSADLGIEAATRALAAAGNPDVDCLVVATCSPDTLIPSTACLIQRRLGLDGIPAFDVNAACSGFVYGLAIANSLVRSGAAGRVLLVATEALSRLVDYGDRATCVLFGDGAGAAVIGPAPAGSVGIRAVRWAAAGGEGEIIYYGPKQDEPEGEDRIRMLGRGTFRTAVERLCGMAAQLCEDAGWDLTEVDWFVPHQANLRIIEAAAKRMGVEMSRVVVNVDEAANTSAASIPLALDDALRRGLLRPGNRVICVAFGGGVTWGGAAMEWTAG